MIEDLLHDHGVAAQLDSDGFPGLTDRRSRFSKLGGEMISPGAAARDLSEAVVAWARARTPSRSP